MRRATTGLLSAFLIAAAAIPPLGPALARSGYYPSQPQQRRPPQQPRDYRYQPDPRYRPERGGYLNNPTCGISRTCGYR